MPRHVRSIRRCFASCASGRRLFRPASAAAQKLPTRRPTTEPPQTAKHRVPAGRGPAPFTPVLVGSRVADAAARFGAAAFVSASPARFSAEAEGRRDFGGGNGTGPSVGNSRRAGVRRLDARPRSLVGAFASPPDRHRSASGASLAGGERRVQAYGIEHRASPSMDRRTGHERMVRPHAQGGARGGGRAPRRAANTGGTVVR